MAFELDVVKKQVIAILGLAPRDVSGVAVYSPTVADGDTSYHDNEIERAIVSGNSEIMRAICETVGHGHRYLFTAPQALTHEEDLPAHIGEIGVPRITPFNGAGYTIVGKRKSVEEINAYRHNPDSLYSTTAHNASSNGLHSKLAGFYAIDGEVIYFTGYSAVSDVANFVESDYSNLPDMYYPHSITLGIKNLKKDGDVSDIFSYYQKEGLIALSMIRGNKMTQPSILKTIGTKDKGDK